MSLRKPQQCAKPGRPFGHNTTFLLIRYAWKQTTSEYLKITWRTDVHFTIVSVQMKFQECLENLDQESRLYAGAGDTSLIYNDSWLDHFERDQECRVWWQWHPAPLNHPLAYWGPALVFKGDLPLHTKIVHIFYMYLQSLVKLVISWYYIILAS